MASLAMTKKYFELVALKTDATIEDLRIPIYNDTGKLRGFAHLVVQTVEQAQRILQEYNNTKFNGQPIHYHRAKKPIKSDNDIAKTTLIDTDGIEKEASTRIQINNLSFAATEMDIQSALEPYTNRIVDIRVTKQTTGHEINQSKGYGFVTFESIQDAKVFMAKASNEQITILDRPCSFDYNYKIQQSTGNNNTNTNETPTRRSLTSPSSSSSSTGGGGGSSSKRSSSLTRRRRKSNSGSAIAVPTSTDSPTKNVQPYNLKY